MQKLETRNLLTAVPLGATPLDTGEFLLGRVVVTPVLLESNGQTDPQTQNWSSAEVDAMLAKISEGVNWWSDTLDELNTVHSLDFIIDTTFAKDPQTGAASTYATPYEPIDRSSNFYSTYVSDFLEDQGYGSAGTIANAIRLFNHEKRIEHEADWAFTIFVVDSSNDSDGTFAGGDFQTAFAFAGGQFFVTPSTRPASTIAHEMGHIFWARDEYPGAGSYTDRRGYYNAQNINAADNPNGGQQPSIMRGGAPLQEAYIGNFSPESTLALIGWRDSDSDGIFDVSDVPLRLDAVGSYDSGTSTYRLVGEASAEALINRNSSGLQSDITLNRISEIQYSLDGGGWITAASPDLQSTDIDLQITINQDFDSIRWRAIDQSIGVTSNIVSGSRLVPAMPESSLSGFAYVDANNNGLRDPDESPLADAVVTLTTADGGALPSGSVAAGDFQDGEIPGLVDGASLFADGTLLAAELASFRVAELGDARVFHAFNRQSNRYQYLWSDRAAFVANLDTAVGHVEIDMIGVAPGSYGRLEVYDASGNLIDRITSDLVGSLQTETLTISDPSASISSIRFFGHGQTSAVISAVRFETKSQTTTDSHGAWQLANLPEGEYRINIRPQTLIHRFDVANFPTEVNGQNGSTIRSAATRIESPRYNSARPVDVTGDGELTAQDALIVINDLNRYQARLLGEGESSGPSIDVNNDGSVSSLDALLVVNALSRQSINEGESAIDQDGPATAPSEPTALVASTGPTVIAAGSRSTPIPFAPAAPIVGSQGDVPTSILGAKDHILADWPASPRSEFPTIDSALDPDWSDARNSVDRETGVEGITTAKADTPNASDPADPGAMEREFGSKTPLRTGIGLEMNT